MKTNKIILSDEIIDFLSKQTQEKAISLKEAITEWNREQEVRKYLGVGDIVKIYREDEGGLGGKKGFIGSVQHPCGAGFDPDRSGKFSVWLFEYNEYDFQADLLGYELEPTGESISHEELIEYMKNIDEKDTLYYELDNTLQEIN